MQVADADSTWNAQPGAMPAVLWQAHLVNDLLRAYAPSHMGLMEKECWLLLGWHQRVAWDF